MNPHSASSLNRRDLLGSLSGGLLAAALASLGESVRADESHRRTIRPATGTLARKGVAQRPRAKAVIQLFMNGGPSQMDLFDPKPALDKHHGESYFNEIAGEVENPGDAGAIMRSPFKFKNHGECGMPVSEVMPHLAECVDDLTLIRSLHTVNLTHEPSIYMAHCGHMLPGLPTLGAWVTYGLGSENEELPAYVVLDDPKGLPINGTQNWQSGYLPPAFQGVRFRAEGDPVLHLKPAYATNRDTVQLQQQLLAELDRLHAGQRPHQGRLAARMKSYELAAKMQITASDALDLRRESPATQQLYGLDRKTTESYGRRCLLARRLVERGVRFVQLFIDGQIWDHHSKIRTGLRTACERTDKPIAGLLQDLKQRGLLEETLVVWGGEFGRLPIAQLHNGSEANAGRDHNKEAMCLWMAGGGMKSGFTYGATDELGMRAVEDRVSIHDWHATLLHALGLDHEQLTYNRNGLDERLTGVHPCRVMTDWFA